jgi:hypothetical protein
LGPNGRRELLTEANRHQSFFKDLNAGAEYVDFVERRPRGAKSLAEIPTIGSSNEHADVKTTSIAFPIENQ